MNQFRRVVRFGWRTLALTGMSLLAYVLAYQLRFAGDVPAATSQVLLGSLFAVLLVKTTFLMWFRLHEGWSRYVSFHDITVLAKSITWSTIGITLCDSFLLNSLTIPRSVLILDWVLSLMAVATARALPRLVRDTIWLPLTKPAGARAIIVGATDAGEALLRTIQRNPKLGYHPVGFVDGRQQHHGRRIAGVPVLGTLEDLSHYVNRYRVQEVLITAGELPGKRVRKLVETGVRQGFRIRVLPSYEQLLAEQVDIQPRPVAIADLLGRPSIELDQTDAIDWLSGRTLLVTGSSGSIGSEICRQILKLKPAKLLVLDRSETGQFFLERELRRLAPQAQIEVVMADINDAERMEAVFQQYRPEIVFHAAAYKHVPLMEAHVGEGVKNIALATRRLADLAEQYEAESFVMISTDKAVNPTSVMGSCKRLAEQYVQAKATGAACRFVTVRFGNVLDSAGSVIPIFREQIARGGPVTVTDENMIRYFMMIPEAAQLVIQAGAMGQGGEIFVLDMGEPVRIVDLARDMIRLSGLRVDEDIEIRFSGLRPGEKLYEELYADEEHHQRTDHPKIMVANSQTRPLVELIYDLRRLEDISNGPNEACDALLRQIVPRHTAATDTDASEMPRLKLRAA